MIKEKSTYLFESYKFRILRLRQGDLLSLGGQDTKKKQKQAESS